LQNTFESIDFRVLGGIHLTGVPGDNANALLARPRLVALLATLAVAETGWVRRDQLIALFWPETTQERARAALRKSVYLIRQALGEESVVNRGAEELGLGPHVSSDHARFRAAYAAGDLRTALAHYQGELLPAFHLTDAPDWEHWADAARVRIRTQALDAARTLIAEASDHRDHAAAVEWARRAESIAPENENVVRELIELLDQSGDRSGALQAYRAFEQRLRSEYDAAPAPETIALFERIRNRTTAREVQRVAGAAEPEIAAPAVESTFSTVAPGRAVSIEQHEAARSGAYTRGEAIARGEANARGEADGTLDESARQQRAWLDESAERGSKFPGTATFRRVLLGVLVLVAVVAIVLGRQASQARAEDEVAPIAVGGITDYTGSADSIGAALADLLATSLARVPGLPVLSSTRLFEIVADASVAQRSMGWAARRAGARVLLEGAVHRNDDGSLRLELRRVDLSSGEILASYSATGRTLLDLVNRITVQIASTMQLSPPAQPLAGVTTSSDTAYLLYESGLRAYYREDLEGARELFERALDIDSSFALANWYLARTLTWQPGWIPAFERAVRLSARATERERLMIHADWAYAMDDPSLLAIADTLSTRYPLEPSGHLMMGIALMNVDRPLEALPHFRRVIQLDTLSLLEVTASCRACDALWNLAGAYGQADSAEAAERVARAWVKASPRSAAALGELAYKLEFLGRYDEAEAALHAMHQVDPSYHNLEQRLAGLEIARGRFAQAERYARDALRLYPNQADDSRWLLAMSLLNQGRLREALAYADSFRLRGGATQDQAYLRGMILQRMHRGREAAALFDSVARAPERHSFPDTRRARQLAGRYLHVAEAVATLGDTVKLRELETLVRDHGARSGYGRDQRLHHYVRGLRLALHARYEDAAEAFRQAVFGAGAGGYPPVAVELGRALLAADRPAEAIPWLRAPLHGPVGAGGTWIWRTEIHELLAIAYDQDGQRERALEHYRIAHEALQSADAELAPMRARIASRIAALADR